LTDLYVFGNRLLSLMTQHKMTMVIRCVCGIILMILNQYANSLWPEFHFNSGKLQQERSAMQKYEFFSDVQTQHKKHRE